VSNIQRSGGSLHDYGVFRSYQRGDEDVEKMLQRLVDHEITPEEAMALYKREKLPTEVGRCCARSDQGLKCGLPVGHEGAHNALGWSVSLPPKEPSDG